MIRVSIATPTFNQAATIRQTIESVLSQDYPEVEYWVVDGGSTDGTVDILREYEKNPRFHWLSKDDEGQGDAINKGLSAATGEIFNWINSDDYLEPGALRKVAAAFEKNPDKDIVSGQTAEFYGEPPQIYNYVRLQIRETPEESIVVGVYCQPSTFWRTSVFREMGGIEKKLHFILDWHLWVKYLALHGQERVLIIDDLLAHYRQHPNSKTTRDSDKFYVEAEQVFHDLLSNLQAPAELIDTVCADSQLPTLKFQFSGDFDRELFFGKYCERLVRIYRLSDLKKAKVWLNRSFAFKPVITLWRMKMALRLLFK
jgi:glycosyltransferase involved in cell wall biosynthesis